MLLEESDKVDKDLRRAEVCDVVFVTAMVIAIVWLVARMF